tara:strand:- start:1522 stop:3144 length:1623 start_codon:yes stop_codon:yes gene_type:complete
MSQTQGEKSLNINQSKEKHKIFFLITLVFSFPLFNFVGSNLYQLPLKNIYQIISYNLIIFFIFFLIVYLFNKITNKNFFNNFLSLVFVFWILFQFENIKFLSYKYSIEFASEISLLILLLFFFIFIFLFKNQKKFFIRFLIIFFLIQYSFLFFQIYKNYFYKKNNLNLTSNTFMGFTEDKINKIKEKKNRNIYYVILDEMTSLEQFEAMFGAQYKNINSIYELNDFHYINDYASFNLTTLTLASILNLNRIVEVGDNISNYNHNKILFPKSLSKVNFKTFQQPKLLKLLDNLDYEFIWIGNNWGNCNNYNESLCLNKNFQKKKIINKVNMKLLNIFLRPTPYEIIMRKISQIFKGNIEAYVSGNDFEENDAIGKLLNSNKKVSKSKNYFFLIHHFSPHNPYIYNSNCSYDSSIKNNFEEELEGYKNNYLCTIKKIHELINFIEDTDPESVIVIQGDHGFKNDDNFIKNDDINKFKIFNLIKTPKDCNDDYKLKKNLGNINSIRIALNCALDEDIKLIENFPVFSNKKNKKFGKVKKFLLN